MVKQNKNQELGKAFIGTIKCNLKVRFLVFLDFIRLHVAKLGMSRGEETAESRNMLATHEIWR